MLEGGRTVVLTYKSENFAYLADRIGIWPFPRAHHRNVAYIRHRGTLFLVADGARPPDQMGAPLARSACTVSSLARAFPA